MAGRRHGFTSTEALIASAIMAVAVTAMFGLWSGMFKRIGTARLASGAGQLARAEVERAKVFGMDNLPLGTYSAATGQATWTGSFSPTANAWVANAAAYFNASGTRLSASNSPGVALKVQASIVDSNVLPKTGGYSFQLESRRSFVVTVWQTSDNTQIFKVGTIIAPGGL